MLYKLAYSLGVHAAKRQLGFKYAQIGKYLLPALGGGTFGAGVGGLAAPEGQGLQGALMGAGLGAAGAAGGRGLAQLAGKGRSALATRGVQQAEQSLAKLGPDVITPANYKQVAEAEKALAAATERATASKGGLGLHETGGAMLGGVLGTGGAMYANKPKVQDQPRSMDPYGYSRGYR